LACRETACKSCSQIRVHEKNSFGRITERKKLLVKKFEPRFSGVLPVLTKNIFGKKFEPRFSGVTPVMIKKNFWKKF
jgi:predicted component of type VI protein secretion system